MANNGVASAVSRHLRKEGLPVVAKWAEMDGGTLKVEGDYHGATVWIASRAEDVAYLRQRVLDTINATSKWTAVPGLASTRRTALVLVRTVKP